MKSDDFSLPAFVFLLVLILSCGLPASSQTNVPGTAVSLNGTTNAWLNVPNGTWFSGNFTVEGWVYARSYNSWSRLIDFSDGPNANNVYLALSDSTTGDPALGVFTNNNGSPFMVATNTLPINQWVHLAATGNGTNGTIYLNGAPVGTGMLNVAPNVVRTNNYIGRSAYSADGYANAIFDDLRIWNVARTRAQIQTSMNHPLVGNEPGLAGYWRFDDGTGTNAFDSTGNGNTATLNSGVTWTNSTAPLTNAADYALSFNGAQVVTIPHQAAHDSYPFTVMCWFMEPTNSPGGGALVGNYVSSSFNGWQLALSGGLYAWYYRDSGDHVGNTSAGPVNDGLWHHAAFVVNSAGGVIYLDGVPKQTNAWAGTAGPCTTTEAAFLGIYQGDSLLTANVDEVSLWNAALTPSQIQTYMHQPLQGTESGLVSYYRMNEGIGTNIYDYTTNAVTGTFSTPPPAWIISGAQIQEPPQIVTLPATTNGNSVTLSGTINPQGLNSGSWFQWGLTTGYGNTTATNTFAASYTISTNTITLSGLAAGTYHFQIVATNSSGTNYGVDQSFTITVSQTSPQVATLPATLNGTSATLNGTVNPEGLNTGSWFNWGLSTSYGNVTPINTFAAGFSLSTNTSTLSGLAAGTYHFQIVATNALGTNYGMDQSFTIQPPQVVTFPATLNGALVTLSGTVNPEGQNAGSWFNWGLTTSYGNVTPINAFAAGFNLSTNTSLLNGLFSGTYHFQIVATNAVGTSYGADQTFTVMTQYQLGNTNIVEGAASGEDSVVLSASPTNAGWSATANASWLHALTSSGVGSTNVIFSFDTNSGTARSGTLTIAGQTLTVSQAGSAYVQAPLTTIVPYPSAGSPTAIAVDSVGDVYIATYNNGYGILEWNPTNNAISTNVPFNSGLSVIPGIAVDSTGDLFSTDFGSLALKEWPPNNGVVRTLYSGLQNPAAVAVDASGNAYFSDLNKFAIYEWVATNNSVKTLISGPQAQCLAADAANNLYFSTQGGTSNMVRELIAQNGKTNTLINYIQSTVPESFAVDGGGNLYIANYLNNSNIYTMTKWSAAIGNQTSLIPSATLNSGVKGVGVDTARNLYISIASGPVYELPNAFLDPTAKSEPATAGADSLPGVLPAGFILNGPFAPTKDQSWLTITGTANGVVSYSFTANTNPTPRTAHIQLLGQSIAINQTATVIVQLGATNLLEGPARGTDSVVVVANPLTLPWPASANATWLHLTATNQIGDTNLLFTFDTNTNVTRTGTITIGHQTLTVTQAGSNFVAASASSLAAVLNPYGIAMDSAGNIYWAVGSPPQVQELIATNYTIITLVSNGLVNPVSVAVDSAHNVYIADSGESTIMKWTAATGNLTTLVGSGLNQPAAVALDTTGNVYIADTQNNAIKEWLVASSNVVTLVSTGLNNPSGVAVDLAGNVYIADSGNFLLKEWSPTSGNVKVLASADPYNLAVDGSGNVFMGEWTVGEVLKWSPDGVVSVAANGISWGAAVDSSGNLFFAENGYPVGEPFASLVELPRAFLVPAAKAEPFTAGNDSLPAVLPANVLQAPWFYPVSNQPWVAITGVTNGVVSFSFTANTNTTPRTAQIILLGQYISINQAGVPVTVQLGTTNILVGGAGGRASDIMLVSPPTSPWTVTANATWLHPMAGYQSGTGGTNVIFTFDSNPGAARAGTFTIGNQTLTVTQAPSNYVAVTGAPATIVNGLNSPWDVALDTTGNIYIADPGVGAIREWINTNNTIITLVSNLSYPEGVALDNKGNVYFSDVLANSIMEWTAANSNVTTLVSSGLSYPSGIAVDNSGNVYIADSGHNAIKEWIATNGDVITLVSGLNDPSGVAVDIAGNVYIGDTSDSILEEWSPATASVTTLATSAGVFYDPRNLAVDGPGNVFSADFNGGVIQEWSAANGTVSMAASTGLSGVGVDGSDNIYVPIYTDGTIRELQRAFVDPSARRELFAAGNDSLPAVFPTNVLLTGPFAPSSDQPWVTITGVTNGAVSFSFTANSTGASRTANINLAGQLIAITQGYVAMSTSNLLEGPTAGADSVMLEFKPPQLASWTASANASWLHAPAGNLSSAASVTNFVFTFDANSGPTRTGTLNLSGMTLAVTQAGVTYVPAPGPPTSLVTNGLSGPSGVAVDNSGYVYIADTGDQVMDEWVEANNSLEPIVYGGLGQPTGVAFNNAAGLLVYSDKTSNIVYAWQQGFGNTLYPFITSGLNGPSGLALDSSDNVYIADTGNNSVEEFSPFTGHLVTLVSGLNGPEGVALDAFGDVYIADTGNSAIKEWFVANSNVVTIVSSGLNHPAGVAVDASGNIFIADTGDNAIKEWVAASGSLTTLAATVNHPTGIALDSADDLYIADTGNSAVEELPRAFVDTTAIFEPWSAGSDTWSTVLPASVNLLPPFAPTSDQSWLNVTDTSGGIVSFAFTANIGTLSPRTAHLNVLGVSVSVTQTNAPVLPSQLTGAQVLGNGAFQFTFTNTPGTTFTVLATTNLALPLANWVNLGTVSNISPGIYEFTSPLTNSQEFYEVIWP